MQVQVKKTMRSKGERDSLAPNEDGNGSPRVAKGMRAPTIRRSKLLIVDLAGSERVDKSGNFTWVWRRVIDLKRGPLEAMAGNGVI